MVAVAPSILAADFAELGAAIDLVAPAAAMLHVDIMDGHFVPNLSIGPPVVKSLRARTTLPLDCHLMMTNPGDYLKAFKDAGSDGLTIHVEIGNTSQLLADIGSLGMKRGLSLNPVTLYEEVEPFLDQIDLLLFMTVMPGFGGQKFRPEVLPAVERARAAIDARGLKVEIEIDGGIDENTAQSAVDAGVDILVAGTAIFGRPDPLASTKAFAQLERRALHH